MATPPLLPAAPPNPVLAESVATSLFNKTKYGHLYPEQTKEFQIKHFFFSNSKALSFLRNMYMAHRHQNFQITQFIPKLKSFKEKCINIQT